MSDVPGLTRDPRLSPEDAQLVARAAVIAQTAHGDQRDKADQPYFAAHVLDVHRRVVEYGGDVIEQVAALLHDVVEDTDHTLEELAAKGMPPAALEIVRLLTKMPGEPKDPYYARIREHEPARRVKLLADVASNSDPGRLALLPPEERAKKSVKYAQARVALGG